MFSLRVSPAMARDPGLNWQPLNNYVWTIVERSKAKNMTFYPVIRYRGMRVHPMWWKEDSAEPVLVVQSPTGSEDYPKGVDPWKFVDELVRAGWKWDQREGGTGSVHVDDLEKIEGPPPASPF